MEIILIVTLLEVLYFQTGMGLTFNKDMFHRTFVPDSSFDAELTFTHIGSLIECGGLCLSNDQINFRFDNATEICELSHVDLKEQSSNAQEGYKPVYLSLWRVDITTVGLISARNDTNNEENDVSIVLPNGRTCSPTSIPKMRFSLLGAVDYHQGKLIHCGGAGPSWTYISDGCVFLDLESDQPWTWEPLENSQLESNLGFFSRTFTKVLLGDRYVVTRYRVISGTPTYDVIVTKVSSAAGELVEEARIPHRGSFSAIFWDSEIYLIGGKDIDSNELNTVMKFDVRVPNSMTQMTQTLQETDLNVFCCLTSVLAALETAIICIGRYKLWTQVFPLPNSEADQWKFIGKAPQVVGEISAFLEVDKQTTLVVGIEGIAKLTPQGSWEFLEKSKLDNPNVYAAAFTGRIPWKYVAKECYYLL